MTEPTTFRAAREETIDALCREFARDSISMPELERRLARAREARTRSELKALLSDLGPALVPATAGSAEPAGTRAATPARKAPPGEPAARTSSHLAFAILGGTRRAGRWVVPDTMAAVAIMGGVELDFRDAVLRPGVTEINCFAFWGGIEITVPPGVHVDTHGFALMGGFEQVSDLESDPPRDAPVIRVNGFAFMGGVEVKVREPGDDRRRGAPVKRDGRRGRAGREGAG